MPYPINKDIIYFLNAFTLQFCRSPTLLKYFLFEKKRQK